MKEAKLQMKNQLVEEIKEKIQSAQSITLVNYRGVDVEAVTELRAKYRAANVDYKVYKNTMMRRAFEELGYEGISEFLTGPSAVAFSMEDAVAGAKISDEFAEEHEAFEIKSGIVEGKVFSTEDMRAFAKLPSKEVLIAQVLYGLNANITGLAMVLQAIAEKKESEATA